MDEEEEEDSTTNQHIRGGEIALVSVVSVRTITINIQQEEKNLVSATELQIQFGECTTT